MKAHGNTALRRFQEYLCQDSMVDNGKSVIGNAYRAGFMKTCYIGNLLTLHSKGCIAGHIDMYGSFGGFLLHIFESLRIVASGIGISHHDDRGISSPGRCRSTRVDILLVRETGIPEVDMYIHQSRRDYKTRSIYYLISGLGLSTAFRQNTFNLTFTEYQIRFPVHSRLRIHQRSVQYQKSAQD